MPEMAQTRLKDHVLSQPASPQQQQQQQQQSANQRKTIFQAITRFIRVDRPTEFTAFLLRLHKLQ